MSSDPPPEPYRWTALLLAGSRPGDDPFAEANGVALKPLIPIADEPMVVRPLRALLASPNIRQVRVLTQAPEAFRDVLPTNPRLAIEQSGATIAATIEAILADKATRYPLLITTADHALLDPAMIEEFCAKAAGADLAIGIVERRTLMARLPQTKRTWIGFRGGAYSGANLFAFASPRAASAVALWRSVEQDRKTGWRMLAAFGPTLLLGAGLRLRTLEQSLSAIGRKLGLTLMAVEMTDPLAAVDVDKPADLALVETLLRDRA
ncbi:MAG: NTP transferase domain-containing protein [Sphingomicrobium sp.]|nr:nucleotidyltransferase family protein [Sphingomonadales bacterium]